MKILAVILAWLLGCASTPADPATVRREVEAQYGRLAAAFQRQDVSAVLGMRTPDFHTIGPDGRHLDATEMEAYTRHWFEMNHPPIVVRFTVRSIAAVGPDDVAVTVFQEGSRFQELAGKRRRVDHNVIQRETWRRTPAGWRIRMVDDVHDQKRWVDGVRVDPTKPYDPEAAPFSPAAH
jgi:ketosteroid isomerase-like protein